MTNLFDKRQRIPKGQSEMDNREELIKYGTQDEDEQNKNTTQYVLMCCAPLYVNKDT